jgi:hypothetical protein
VTTHLVRLSSSVTVAQYLQIEANDDREGAGKFIKERFDERYLSPMLDVDGRLRHGFSMMAVACLTIEALQAFRSGLSTTRNKSRNMFAAFFAQHPAFSDFADGDWFYDDIRCGLLHDAEGRGGWRILRKGPLVDKNDRAINATRFLRALRGAVNDYATELQEDRCWALFQKKMKQVIKNCER